MTIEDAVDRAVNECIEAGVLKAILAGHRAEVKDMILTEYDEEKTMRLFQKEYEEEAAKKIAQVQAEADRKVAEADKKVAEIQKKTEEEIRQLQKEIENLKQELKQAISRL